MPFRLVVEFGGLCLFVARKDRTTGRDLLTVLLPANGMHSHGGMRGSEEHIPRIAMKYIGGYDSRHISKTPQSVNWSSLDAGVSPRRPLPKQLLALTTTLGDARVTANCFEDPLPPTVAVRFDLPFPRLFFPVGQDACVEVEFDGSRETVQTVGRVCGVWDVHDDSLEVPEFGTVEPASNDWLELFVRNTPVPDVIGENPPPVGSPLTHVHHYLPLLTKGDGAQFSVACRKLIYQDQDDPMNVATPEFLATGGFSPMSVNPFACAVASGCGEGDSAC